MLRFTQQPYVEDLMRKLLSKILIITSVPLFVAADFTIDVVFDDGMDNSYKAAFSDAVTFWESNITGYRSPANWEMSGITINAAVQYIDGQYGVLGSAGPDYVTYGSTTLNGDDDDSLVCYSTEGSMQFDSADVDMMIGNGSWGEVIRHEMAHVIGFGTLWGIDLFGNGTIFNDFYVDGSGEYTGAAGLAAYQAEFDPDATFVPVELGGGGGTANGHWNEVDNGGLVGVGSEMTYELMTGWLNSPTYLSDTTLGQFEDLGYTVIPEPATFGILSLGLSFLLGYRRCKYSKIKLLIFSKRIKKPLSGARTVQEESDLMRNLLRLTERFNRAANSAFEPSAKFATIEAALFRADSSIQNWRANRSKSGAIRPSGLAKVESVLLAADARLKGWHPQRPQPLCRLLIIGGRDRGPEPVGAGQHEHAEERRDEMDDE